ncbi:MAG: cation:proton antiporter [Verrucomicrobiae bacterium]|nr:cation:proton antiporter [Verrucomicrobiae bacterium]MCP5551385.1 cation:proton antiporter [Akkermansiaceae bacterium]
MLDESLIRSLGLIVLAAAAFSLVARAAGLPTILAYLTAGLFLGPLTGLIGESEAVAVISETGIVLLLFLVGLEMTVEKMRKAARVALVAGSIQIVATTAGGYLLFRMLGFASLEALVAGVALSFSSTVMVVKALVESRESGGDTGRVTIGILLMQDLFVIVLLTVMASLEGSEGDKPAAAALALAPLRALGGMVLLLGGVLAASRWLLPRPFAWASKSPEVLFIWSLAWCFLVVAATHALRLSHEIGAFVAGVSLARLPYNHDLQRRVHPLSSFFLAVFLVALGIGMHPEMTWIFWGKAAAISVFVIGAKFLLVVPLAARLGYPGRVAFSTGLLLTQISEFSLIFAALAARKGYLGESGLSLVGMTGLLTFSGSALLLANRDALWERFRGLGIRRLLAGGNGTESGAPETRRQGHVIVVGMNTLGRELAGRLHRKGLPLLAIDTDPRKLAGLPCPVLLGDAGTRAVLDEANFESARFLVSTLHIEATNDLLAFRCRRAGIPCAIHAVDLNDMGNLLAMDVDYLIVPKADGLNRQWRDLEELASPKRKEAGA